MTHHDRSPDAPNLDAHKRPFLNTPARFALCLFLAIAGIYLWIEHRAHILGVLPLLLPLIICLGMHFFMHRGHRQHGGGRHER